MSASHNDTFSEKMIIFIRKLSICPACKGSKIIKSMGGIETPCNQCGKFIIYFNRYYMQPVGRYIVKPFMMHLVPLTVLAFFIMTCLAFSDPAPAKIAGSVSFFGSIFAALAFKLNQANYHKDLFQKRYEIFLVINDVLADWCGEAKSTNEMISKISGDLMRRSYFLFGRNTYEFVTEFRRALI